jgi:phenylalanyl-tRNA synthetase beta chain
VYPSIKEKTIIEFEFAYLKKLSGKLYNPADIKNILTAVGFEITHETTDHITLKVPFSKPDISIQADIVEEIMRIDGLDNVEIPAAISIVPSKDKTGIKSLINEKLANYLIGQGLNEMFTNSITNSSFYSEEALQTSVKMINSLTKELDIMRPGLLQSGLQVLSHNINRKNTDLRFFELGKTYHIAENSKYVEKNHLAIFITGNMVNQGWKFTEQPADFFYLKGIVENIFLASGIRKIKFTESSSTYFSYCSNAISGKLEVAQIGAVSDKLLKQFDIKQPVYFADINMDLVIHLNEKAIQYKEISKFPAVKRDLALVVDKKVSYSQIQDVALTSSINQLKTIDLFDVYENDKLGNNKKSMAVSFTFLDEHKTMTDQEIDGFMKKLVSGFEKNIQAEIRK